MKIDLNKYVGKWYEIARIPADFEPDMTNVVAEYSLLDNGNIQVVNSGYINGEFREIVGFAKTTNRDDLLRVSFFPGIYSDYKILAIDVDYQLALIGGNNKNYLWILSRYPKIKKNIYDYFVNIAKEKGFNINKLEVTKY